MKIAILGTSLMTQECAEEFLKSKWEIAAVISLPESKKPLNSIDLRSISDKAGAVYYETDDINDEKTELFLKGLELDYIFSAWPYLLKENILKIPRYYVIGSHPTQLPYNRGRHALHWLISMGIRESCVSLFVMDSGIDSGNILVQEKYSCLYDYGIQDVNKNMIESYKLAIQKLCILLEKDPENQGMTQNSGDANYWRKRNIFDIMIDFRMRARDIERLVKSFNRPYECAVLLYKENMIRIGNAEVLPYIDGDELHRIEPGKVIHVQEKYITVKAADKIIRLDADGNRNMQDVQFGSYIYPPAKYIVEYPNLFNNIAALVR